MPIESSQNIAEQHSAAIRSHANGLEGALTVEVSRTNTTIRDSIQSVATVSNLATDNVRAALLLDADNFVQIGAYFSEADELAKMSMINT